jgi:hypothetical protein
VAKKSKKNKLPKKIAGVKVPKELRKAGGKLARIAEQPVAREIAFAALAAGLAARTDARKAAKKAAVETGGELAENAGWVSAALAAAALEASRRLVDVIDDGKGGDLVKLVKAAAGSMNGGGSRH